MREDVFNLEEKEGKRFISQGRCIYCGDTEAKRSREHIIPYALGADTAILEDASCEVCQKTIQPYEQRVLKDMLGTFRAQLEAPTRRPTRRPTSEELHIVEIDAAGTIVRELVKRLVPLDQHPIALASWELAPPRILGENCTEAQHYGRPWVFQSPKIDHIIAEVRRETGCTGHIALRIARKVDRTDFLRFLAKVAHCYAVAEHGIDAFEHELTDYILCRRDDLDQVVGGITNALPYTNDESRMLQLTSGVGRGSKADGYIGVAVHIYPFLDTPAHLVIVGRSARLEEESA